VTRADGTLRRSRMSDDRYATASRRPVSDGSVRTPATATAELLCVVHATIRSAPKAAGRLSLLAQPNLERGMSEPVNGTDGPADCAGVVDEAQQSQRSPVTVYEIHLKDCPHSDMGAGKEAHCILQSIGPPPPTAAFSKMRLLKKMIAGRARSSLQRTCPDGNRNHQTRIQFTMPGFQRTAWKWFSERRQQRK
jgi:hypothetical protein